MSPSNLSHRISRGWRILRTGGCFLAFGLFSLFLSSVIMPLLRLLPGTEDERARRAQRATHYVVGTHVRLPRRYRGRDILAWMVDIGAFRAPAAPAEERRSAPAPRTTRHSPRDSG